MNERMRKRMIKRLNERKERIIIIIITVFDYIPIASMCLQCLENNIYDCTM
jgi:hypothetical protein